MEYTKKQIFKWTGIYLAGAIGTASLAAAGHRVAYDKNLMSYDDFKFSKEFVPFMTPAWPVYLPCEIIKHSTRLVMKTTERLLKNEQSKD